MAARAAVTWSAALRKRRAATACGRELAAALAADWLWWPAPGAFAQATAADAATSHTTALEPVVAGDALVPAANRAAVGVERSARRRVTVEIPENAEPALVVATAGGDHASVGAAGAFGDAGAVAAFLADWAAACVSARGTIQIPAAVGLRLLALLLLAFALLPGVCTGEPEQGRQASSAGGQGGPSRAADRQGAGKRVEAVRIHGWPSRLG
jgi:hypothetical protein